MIRVGSQRHSKKKILLFIISPIFYGLFNDTLYDSGYITRIFRIISKKCIKESVN